MFKSPLSRYGCQLLRRRIHVGVKLANNALMDQASSIKDDDVVPDETAHKFRLIKSLNVTTIDGIHQVSIDSVLNFMDSRIVNKGIKLQYCHFLANLVKESKHSPRECQLYAQSCSKLAKQILSKESLAAEFRYDLICTVSDLDADSCREMVNYVLRDARLQNGIAPHLSGLASSCYKHQLWKEATSLLEMGKNLNEPFMDQKVIDPFVLAFNIASEQYVQAGSTNETLRADVIENQYLFFEMCREQAVYFETGHGNEFINGLRGFGFDVKKDPLIKGNCRCTRCNSYLPKTPTQFTDDINEEVRRLVKTGELENVKGNFLNQQDLDHFSRHIQQLTKRRPLSCVIDGCNVGYRHGGKTTVKKIVFSEELKRTVFRQDPEVSSMMLINFILRSKLLETHRNLIVIGKKHMHTWKGLSKFLRENHVEYYFANDRVLDDYLLLYAATLSPDSVLITHDFYRDHIERANPRTRVKIRRWMGTHQGSLEQKSLKAILPTQYEKFPSVDTNTGFAHVPMFDSTKLFTSAEQMPSHLMDSKWSVLCCKLPGKRIDSSESSNSN